MDRKEGNVLFNDALNTEWIEDIWTDFEMDEWMDGWMDEWTENSSK